MKRISNRVGNAFYGLMASATIMALDAVSGSAHAQSTGTVGSISDKLREDLGSFGKLLVVGIGVTGVGMVAAGLHKLKQASDQGGNGQVKYTDGLWRVGSGACLIAVPAFSGALTNTFGFGTPTISQKTTPF